MEAKKGATSYDAARAGWCCKCGLVFIAGLTLVLLLTPLLQPPKAYTVERENTALKALDVNTSQAGEAFSPFILRWNMRNWRVGGFLFGLFFLLLGRTIVAGDDDEEDKNETCRGNCCCCKLWEPQNMLGRICCIGRCGDESNRVPVLSFIGYIFMAFAVLVTTDGEIVGGVRNVTAFLLILIGWPLAAWMRIGVRNKRREDGGEWTPEQVKNSMRPSWIVTIVVDLALAFMLGLRHDFDTVPGTDANPIFKLNGLCLFFALIGFVFTWSGFFISSFDGKRKAYTTFAGGRDVNPHYTSFGGGSHIWMSGFFFVFLAAMCGEIDSSPFGCHGKALANEATCAAMYPQDFSVFVRDGGKMFKACADSEICEWKRAKNAPGFVAGQQNMGSNSIYDHIPINGRTFFAFLGFVMIAAFETIRRYARESRSENGEEEGPGCLRSILLGNAFNGDSPVMISFFESPYFGFLGWLLVAFAGTLHPITGAVIDSSTRNVVFFILCFITGFWREFIYFGGYLTQTPNGKSGLWRWISAVISLILVGVTFSIMARDLDLVGYKDGEDSIHFNSDYGIMWYRISPASQYAFMGAIFVFLADISEHWVRRGGNGYEGTCCKCCQMRTTGASFGFYAFFHVLGFAWLFNNVVAEMDVSRNGYYHEDYLPGGSKALEGYPWYSNKAELIYNDNAGYGALQPNSNAVNTYGGGENEFNSGRAIPMGRQYHNGVKIEGHWNDALP